MAIRPIPTQASSNIAQVVYDDSTGDLFVQFVRKNTPPYRFKQVPQSTVDQWTQADSAGRYFRGNILHQYDHEVISEIPSGF